MWMTPGTEGGRQGAEHVSSDRETGMWRWSTRQLCTGQAPPAGRQSLQAAAARLAPARTCAGPGPGLWVARGGRGRGGAAEEQAFFSLCRHYHSHPLQPSQLRGHHCSWSRSNKKIKTSWLGRATLNNILTLTKVFDFQAEPTASAKTSGSHQAASAWALQKWNLLAGS